MIVVHCVMAALGWYISLKKTSLCPSQWEV